MTMSGDGRKIARLRPLLPAAVAGVDELEFLPAALDLQAAPPSPIHNRLMWLICALIATALVFTCVSKIDIYAVAAARVQPTGRSKVIQPLATGKVLALHVKNGARVAQGDLLLELDSTETGADRAASVSQLHSLHAEIARRTAAVSAARSGPSDAEPGIQFQAGIDAAVIAREQAVLSADLSNLRSALSTLDGKITESVTQRQALGLTIEAQERLVSSLRDRVQMRQSLVDRQLGSRASVIDAEQELGEQLTVLANQQGEQLRIGAAIDSLKREKASQVARFVADNSQALAAAQAKESEVAQSLVKASAKVDYTLLHSPVKGTVQELAVTTIGQVVTVGQLLMVIVPDEARLEAEALVPNKDIGFVVPGQPAVLKIDAFPFMRYGTLSGQIANVSYDAVASRDATAGGDPSRAVPLTQNLVYPVTVALDTEHILIEGRSMPLLPGMSATVEIRTGERRLIEYFLSPILEVASEAAHER
jgi:hemolysin D